MDKVATRGSYLLVATTQMSAGLVATIIATIIIVGSTPTIAANTLEGTCTWGLWTTKALQIDFSWFHALQGGGASRSLFTISPWLQEV